jgi:hypothetical protein
MITGKMNNHQSTRLDLRASLYFTHAPGLVPFEYEFPLDETMRELLFCFEIDEKQAASIEPDAACFPGNLIFTGAGSGGYGEFCLPAGLYLFTQERRALDRNECICMAIEQQQDALWEKLKPGNRLYIRYLFEDGSPVTQLFRRYHE